MLVLLKEKQINIAKNACGWGGGMMLCINQIHLRLLLHEGETVFFNTGEVAMKRTCAAPWTGRGACRKHMPVFIQALN